MLTQIDQVFEREMEFAAIVSEVLEKRRSMLLFGETGAGKTRLMRSVAMKHPRVAHTRITSSAREILTGILKSMHDRGEPADLLSRLKTASLNGLKGMVQTQLDSQDWILFLDQVQGPGAAISRLVKDLNYYSRTPLLIVARSSHMEDIGTLGSLCFDRKSRLELKSWSPSLSLEFAKRQAHLTGLTATNMPEALKNISERSKGYPGRILDMLHMAKEERYRFDGGIKYHLVSVDYSMRGALSRASSPRQLAKENKAERREAIA